MRRPVSLALLFAFMQHAQLPSVSAQQTSSAAAIPFYGYTAESSKTEQVWETKFRAIPEAKLAHENMKFLAAHPHNVGSAAQRSNAEWMLKKYKEWGWDAHIEQFDVLYPTPKTMTLELLGTKPFKARLTETPLAEDPYTHETATQLPGYNIYSADGDVTGPLVYANYGMLDDYAELERNGISVKGAIVITRYGGGWRGLKPKLAYEHGAVGCIIYSDPADDGYGQNDVLPKGPMRPPQGVQRGSVSDTSMYPGDPLTPGIGSVPGAQRLAIKDAQTIMKIPVLPIGYGDALPFLQALDGRAVPAAWRGGLPLTYHYGPSKAQAHLKLAFNWDTKPVLDVIATMKGSVEPDVWIVRGNHYDGWVNGADDPISGQSGLLEEARALGELARQGWKPRRTLIYAAWDGEEPGLLGSTEWAETHADDLDRHAALYVNSDESNRGFLNASGSHSLEKLINDVAKDVNDPETNVSVYQRQQAAAMTREGAAGRGGARRSGPGEDIPIGAPGSGSDFAAFIDHLGIATVSLGFGGEDRGGTYHSAYDTPWFIEHFGDKESLYGKAMADTAGTLVMRFADADLLPYDFRNLTTTLRGYTAELKALQSQLQRDYATRKRNLDAGSYKLAADPTKPVALPTALQTPPALDFAGLDAALVSLDTAAMKMNAARANMPSSPVKLAKLNAELSLSERKFLSAQGLPRRPWVKDLLYAPGWYTGYGSKTMPGVREALEDGRYPEAAEQLTILSNAIQSEATYVDGIANEIDGAP